MKGGGGGRGDKARLSGRKASPPRARQTRCHAISETLDLRRAGARASAMLPPDGQISTSLGRGTIKMDEHDPIQAEALPGVPGTTEEVTQTAAAFHVQAAMADESAGTAPPAPSVETPARNETPGLLKDVPMADGTEDKAAVRFLRSSTTPAAQDPLTRASHRTLSSPKRSVRRATLPPRPPPCGPVPRCETRRHRSPTATAAPDRGPPARIPIRACPASRCPLRHLSTAPPCANTSTPR